MRWNINLRWN